jgi:nicotinamide-nucleotide amidase
VKDNHRQHLLANKGSDSMATDNVVHQLAIRVGNRLRDERLMLATAESCTGGMIATAITDISGSSGWFERGFVTYSNLAKTEMIGVRPELIERHGAVSEPVARAMAEGALRNSRAQVALAVTGIAGPGGGSELKPVGTVSIAWSNRLHTSSETLVFKGDRAQIRIQASAHALRGLLTLLEEKER